MNVKEKNTLFVSKKSLKQIRAKYGRERDMSCAIVEAQFVLFNIHIYYIVYAIVFLYLLATIKYIACMKM